jgi:hypothetical protein
VALASKETDEDRVAITEAEPPWILTGLGRWDLAEAVPHRARHNLRSVLNVQLSRMFLKWYLTVFSVPMRRSASSRTL